MKINELIEELERLDFEEHEKAELAITRHKSFYIGRHDAELIKKILEVAKKDEDGYSPPKKGTYKGSWETKIPVDD